MLQHTTNMHCLRVKDEVGGDDDDLQRKKSDGWSLSLPHAD